MDLGWSSDPFSLVNDFVLLFMLVPTGLLLLLLTIIRQTPPSLWTWLLMPHASQRQQQVGNSETYCPDCLSVTFKHTHTHTHTHTLTHSLSFIESWGKASASGCHCSKLTDSCIGASQDYPHLHLIITIKLLSLTLIAGIWTDNHSSRHELLFAY